MKKDNSMLFVGRISFGISAIISIISLIINNDDLGIASLFCLLISGWIYSVGKILQKIDELMEVLSPKSIYDTWEQIEYKIRRKKEKEEEVKSKAAEPQRAELDNMPLITIPYWQSSDVSLEYSSVWDGEIRDTELDVTTPPTTTDRNSSLYWRPGQENW